MQISKTEMTQPGLEAGSENCYSTQIMPSTSNAASNMHLVQAINEIKTKLQDIQDASACSNEQTLLTVRTTMDALCKNLLATANPPVTDNTTQSKAYLMNTMMIGEMQSSKVHK